MAAVSCPPSERARKNVALLLQALQEPGKAGALAVAMGVSDSTISRLKNEHAAQFAEMCAHAGIKWVPASHTCVARETYEFLTATFQRVTVQAPQLIWDAEE